jgi:hypothetical protein
VAWYYFGVYVRPSAFSAWRVSSTQGPLYLSRSQRDGVYADYLEAFAGETYAYQIAVWRWTGTSWVTG